MQLVQWPSSYTSQSASLWHVTNINYIKPVRFEGPGGKCQNWIREAYKLLLGNSYWDLAILLFTTTTPMRMIESVSYLQLTYVKRTVRKAHFKMNRVFKVIQGHPYWWRQESRMVCCRNVPLMPTLFLYLRRYGNGKTANSSISMTSRRFEDIPARNAFEYLQTIYIPRN